VIEVEGLRKTYGELVAVDGVTFRAEPGRIFGLLGPNGAGKTTTIGCISGLLTPSAGRIRVLGHDTVLEPRAARAQMGVVPQELALYDELSAEENLRYWGAAYGLRGDALRRRVGEVLEIAALFDRARTPVKKLSGGLKRRLNFACGIVHAPKVVLLDEATVGVDPQSRVRLLDMVRALARAGACVLYTTHYMEEAQSLCDPIGIVDHGKLIALGSLGDLRAMVGERDLVRFGGRFDREAAAAALGGVAGLEVIEAAPEVVRVALPDASRRLPELFAALGAARGEVRETTVIQPSLESLFIKLTGRELRD
jgi:ABC-2 type transport system ATP-binding protein